MSSFFDKLKEGATKAADKAKETVEITRLNAQISSKRKEIDNVYLKIGESVFEAYRANDLQLSEPFVREACLNITTILEEVADLEYKVKVLKNEKECVCGHVVPLDCNFCPKCGHHFEPQPEPKDEAEGDEQEKKVCPSCGNEAGDKEKFCIQCGAELPE